MSTKETITTWKDETGVFVTENERGFLVGAGGAMPREDLTALRDLLTRVLDDTAPSPAPLRVTQPEAYTPKCGDVVRTVGHAYPLLELVVTTVTECGDFRAVEFVGQHAERPWWLGRRDVRYIRPATPAERAAAGLPEEVPNA